MSTSHQQSPILAIIIRYHKCLERYARRLTSHKHRAPDMVKWAIESLYDKGLLQEGPELRSHLIEHTKSMAQGFNRLVAINNHLQSKGAYNGPGLADNNNNSTSQ